MSTTFFFLILASVCYTFSMLFRSLLLALLLALPMWLYPVNFVLFTEPKTGTHLLTAILQELTGKKVFWAKEYEKQLDTAWKMSQDQNLFLHLHPYYSTKLENFLVQKNCVNFFVKRDPRDQVVSLLNHYKYIKFLDKSIEGIPSDEEKLLRMIREQRQRTIGFMGWLTSPVCCVLDFGKLMGAHGESATQEDALEQMRKIANALELSVPDSYLEEVYYKHFGKGEGFFRGKVGSWKEYFNEEHKKATKRAIGDLLISLGYEKDNNW